MHCPSCHHDNRPDRRFCTECGAPLSLACPSCGAPAEPSEKFCGDCGARLQAPSPAPAVSTPTPEPEAGLPAGERRQLTVLFCDLVGSTPLSQQLDAEDWREVIAQYQQVATSAAVRFGGYVAKNLGDGLLIYFGWPTAREDDPERAVRAGLAIVEAMPSLNATLAAGHGTRLAVRIGMHTGPVVIADGGEVFGETANVAARVQGAAGPDTVVITAATQRLAAGLFVVEDLMMSPPALRKFTIGSPRSSKADGSLDTTEDGRLSIDRGQPSGSAPYGHFVFAHVDLQTHCGRIRRSDPGRDRNPLLQAAYEDVMRVLAA